MPPIQSKDEHACGPYKKLVLVNSHIQNVPQTTKRQTVITTKRQNVTNTNRHTRAVDPHSFLRIRLFFSIWIKSFTKLRCYRYPKLCYKKTCWKSLLWLIRVGTYKWIFCSPVKLLIKLHLLMVSMFLIFLPFFSPGYGSRRDIEGGSGFTALPVTELMLNF